MVEIAEMEDEREEQEEQEEQKEREPYVIDSDDEEIPIEYLRKDELEDSEEEDFVDLIDTTGEPQDIDSMRAMIEDLKAQLEEQRKAVEEEHNRYLRALADFNNYKRRHQDEYAKHLELANQDFLLKILPVIDNFERAAIAAEESKDFEALAKGVDLTLKQLHDILEKEGVKPIEAVGQEFDPNLHEAMMRVESDELPENTIVEEFERGYTHKGHVIRPARVKVVINP